MADTLPAGAKLNPATGPTPPAPSQLTAATFAAMAAVWVALIIMAETQAADLAAALAWAVAISVALTRGEDAINNLREIVGR